MEEIENVQHNYAYFPIFINEDYSLTRDELYYKLQENKIFGRRYFYPLISKFPPYRGLPSSTSQNLINAEKAANNVICLPIFPELDIESVNFISQIIKNHS